MVYKLISEWKNPEGTEHEILVYKYNLNHDELLKYFKGPEIFRCEQYYCYNPTKTIHFKRSD